MKPKFTDADKFPPGGYVRAAATDVSKTFSRIRKQMAEQTRIDAEAEAEAGRKVRQIKIKGGKA